MRYFRTLWLLLLVSVLAGCSVSNDAPSLVNHAVTGTVQVPAQWQVALQKSKTSMLARLLSIVSATGWADISGSVGGVVPVVGVTVELVRLSYVPSTGDFYETVVACDGGCPVTDGNGNFTIYTNEPASSNLALRVSFIDPVDLVTPVVMRAMVYGGTVDVNPISEATAQIIIAALNLDVSLKDFTVNEIAALVALIEDEGIDISNATSFAAAIDKIKTEANDLLPRFIAGFKAGGEMNVANPNDIFHIVELRNRLIGPTLTNNLPDGAVDYEATTGGAVSFDHNGDFQIGSALYYWGLRSVFAGDPVRLFDQALNELDQAPASPGYGVLLTYGVPVGFRGITAASNGMAVANSNTEATTYGFLSNDGGMLALLSERNDEGQSIYDRGLRVMMRKWEWDGFPPNTYNETFTNNTINYTNNINGSNSNQGNTTISSIDLNPIMDQGTYNVIMYQHYLNDSGIEVSAGTGQWIFDTTTFGQKLVTDSSVAPSESYHGYVTVTSQNLDALKYPYATSLLEQTAAKALEPCPNLFAITYGGTLNLRRDATNLDCNGGEASIFAGTGAVSSNGEVFVVPQVYDDSADNNALEYTMPVGKSARRGWYIGIKQPLQALTNAKLTGTYHVVGQVTELNDATGTDSVSHQTFHGSLLFHGNGGVDGSLHSKSSTLDDIDTDGVAPILTRTVSVRSDVSGSYVAAADGTVSFTLPGITTDAGAPVAVTGVAGQLWRPADGNLDGSDDVAMFLVIPVNRNATGNGARGIMLLAHEFLPGADYPIAPDPPL